MRRRWVNYATPEVRAQWFVENLCLCGVVPSDILFFASRASRARTFQPFVSTDECVERIEGVFEPYVLIRISYINKLSLENTLLQRHHLAHQDTFRKHTNKGVTVFPNCKSASEAGLSPSGKPIAGDSQSPPSTRDAAMCKRVSCSAPPAKHSFF